MGNPLNLTSVDYLGNKVNATLEWKGRQLSAVIINGQRIEYTYDSSGMRTKMTVYNTDSNTVNTVYYYIWDNDKLLGYIVTDANGVTEHAVKMLFDNTNDSVGYELYSAEDNTTKSYFFLKNLQGDITNVFNENGTDILQYAYDAWGNVTAIFDKSIYEEFVESAKAAVFTPITYRGYMYDQYSGLYYLQSRYYNPLYGRFLNADSIMKTGTPLGANVFAYCGNNPVNYVDYKGLFREEKYKNALVLIGQYARRIIEVASRFGVDPVVVAGVIVAEQTLNVNFIDSLTDKPLYFMDTSIGIGQVKISTAKEVESHLSINPIIETAFVFMDMTVWSVPGIGLVAGSYEYALACRLENDEQNITYVAAYIAYIQEVWRDSGIDISEKPEILATLYNIGIGEPKANPQPNDFGSFVYEHYDEIEIILVFGIIFDILFNGG